MIMDADLRRQRDEVVHLTVEGRKHADNNKTEQAVGCYLQAYQAARKINASTEQRSDENDRMEEVCAFNLAAAYILSKKPKEGLNYLKKAGTPDPKNGDFFFNKAFAHEQLEEIDEALENYEKSADSYENFEMKLKSLEKCLPFYQKRKLFVNKENEKQSAAGVYKRMTDIHRLQNDVLKEALCLYEMATQLYKGKEDARAKEEIDECWNIMDKFSAYGPTCVTAAKILNDAGLFYTKLKLHVEAERCFEKALELIHQIPEGNVQMEAVIQQNLGATYNFNLDWQRAIKFHEDAIDNYGNIGYRNGQGQCFTNLAYAHSQVATQYKDPHIQQKQLKEAEVAFHHALQAAKDTKDKHMKWQVLEGLGDVSHRMALIVHSPQLTAESVKCYQKALLCVGENDPVAADRITAKMMDVGCPRGPGQQPGQHLIYPWTPAPPNFASVATSSTGKDVVRPQRAMVLSAQRPVNNSTAETLSASRPMIPLPVTATAEPKPRRHLRMRKTDSIGPHFPKMARGLSNSLFQETKVDVEVEEEETESETDSSSSSGSDSESGSETDSSDEDQPQPPPQPRVVPRQLPPPEPLNKGSQAKVDAVFRPPADSPDGSPRVTEYERLLQEKEARENARANAPPSTQAEESSSEEDSEDESDSDSESSEEETDSETEVKRAVPPLPIQSPPPTGTTQSVGTYMHPQQPSHNAPHNDQQHTVLSRRPITEAIQPAPGRRSPTLEPAKWQKAPARSGDSSSEEEPPYATIDTTTKQARSTQEEGNALEDRSKSAIILKRQKSGENFFDTDESENEMGGAKKQHKDTSSDEAEEDENPYTSIRFKREDNDSEEDEEEEGKDGMQNLSRGERDKRLYEEHKKMRQKQAEQKEQEEHNQSAKSSKSCIIM